MMFPPLAPYPKQKRQHLDIERLTEDVKRAVLNDIDIEIDDTSKYKLRISAITASEDIHSQTYTSPILCAIKQSNANNILSTQYVTHPFPVGYLFRDNYDGNVQRLLYAPDRPDAPMQEIGTWDRALAAGSTMRDYQVFITKTGDLICLFRGEFYKGDEASRRNPIVYPAGDYDNPVEVDLPIKPMAWLQNSGIDQIYHSSKNYFIFAEYTRPAEGHTKAYVWKVSAPYTDPANWQIIRDEDAEQNGPDGTVKHFHTVNFDPWSGAWLITSGDDNAQIKTHISTDDGETMTQVAGGSQKNRVLNFAFDRDYVYWGSDWGDGTHGLYRVGRDSNGLPDFNTETRLTPLPLGQSTYVTAYLHNPRGLLILDRIDVARADRDGVDVHFWSLEDNKLYTLARFKPRQGRSGTVGTGFRASATTLYQSPSDNRIVVGFDRYGNWMDMLTNRDGNPLNTILLEVV